jgi:hypothetical protein
MRTRRCRVLTVLAVLPLVVNCGDSTRAGGASLVLRSSSGAISVRRSD